MCARRLIVFHQQYAMNRFGRHAQQFDTMRLPAPITSFGDGPLGGSSRGMLTAPGVEIGFPAELRERMEPGDGSTVFFESIGPIATRYALDRTAAGDEG